MAPVLLIASLLAIDAGAQVRPDTLADASLAELMSIVVRTASRNNESVADAAARMSVITEAQIRRRGYRSLLDVLKDLPDFKVDIAGDQDYPTELTVQGSRGAGQVIVLIDGIRVSSPTNEPLPILANYPIHSAQQIELVYGPSSALYGADAFSAVINIISKEAGAEPVVSVDTSVGQYGLLNQSASYAARVGTSGSFTLGGQFQYDRQPDLGRFYPNDFQGLQGQRSGTFNTIFGPMTPLGAVSAAYDVPLSAHSMQARFRTGGLQLSLFENQSRVSTTPADTPDNAVYNSAAFNKNTLLVASGSYAVKVHGVTSTSTVMASRHELSPESGYLNVYSGMEKSYKYAYGSMWKVEEQLAWKPVDRIMLTIGGTLERFFSIPKGADLGAPVRSQNAPGTILNTNILDDFNKLRYANTGAYGQLQYAMTPRVSLTLGARGDYNTRYGATFNPRVGLVTRPAAHTTVKLLYGTAFLAPSPYQSYQHFGSFSSPDGGATYASDYWRVPNPNLKPQKKRAVEGSVQQGVGALFAVSASAFYSYISDKILETDADQAYSGLYLGWPVAYIDFPVNEGNETTYGGTLGLNFVKPLGRDRSVDARMAISVVDGRTSHDDPAGPAVTVPIGGMAPFQARLGTDIRWGLWTVAPRLAVVGRQRVRAFEDDGGSNVRRTLAGYSTVDASLRRQLLKRVGLSLTVENAFDARYRNINIRAYTNPEEFRGSPQNPRRFTVGVHVELP